MRLGVVVAYVMRTGAGVETRIGLEPLVVGCDWLGRVLYYVSCVEI